MTLWHILISVLAGTVALSANAQTPEPKRLGRFSSWLAFESVQQNRKTCYLQSKPASKKGKYKKRGDTYVNVTFLPDRKHRFEVTLVAGYTYNWRSTVRVNVNGRRFRLATDNDIAWVSTPKRGQDFVRAMRKGRWMVVRGRSARGTLTTDTYSLVGFTQAQRLITRACAAR